MVQLSRTSHMMTCRLNTSDARVALWWECTSGAIQKSDPTCQARSRHNEKVLRATAKCESQKTDTIVNSREAADRHRNVGRPGSVTPERIKQHKTRCRRPSSANARRPSISNGREIVQVGTAMIGRKANRRTQKYPVVYVRVHRASTREPPATLRQTRRADHNSSKRASLNTTAPKINAS